jgi:hypothetical protein
MPWQVYNSAGQLLQATDLVDGTVTASKLDTNAVTNAKVADDAIDSAELAAGSVDTAHIAGSQITNALMADDAIGVAELSATGTASSSTFLRGDNAWAAAGGGAMTLLDTVDTSTTANWTYTGLSTTYDTYMIALNGLVPASDGVDAQFRFGDASGIDSGSTEYSYIDQEFNDTSTGHQNTGVNSSTSRIALSTAGVGSGTGEGLSGIFWLHVPVDSSMTKMLSGQYNFVYTNGQHRCGILFGRRVHPITMTQVQFSFGTGNIATGRCSIWGIKHA